MQRFDEMELRSVPLGAEEPAVVAAAGDRAPVGRRILAFFADLSLFVALSLALSPLLPATRNLYAIAALGGFVLLTAYYYFVGSWLLWGKTVGGSIFDIRIAQTNDRAMSVKAASLRFAGMLLSIATAGLGFVFSVPDKISGTQSLDE